MYVIIVKQNINSKQKQSHSVDNVTVFNDPNNEVSHKNGSQDDKNDGQGKTYK